MGNYVGIFEGIDVSVSDYNLDSNIDQQVLKNGLRASIPFCQNWLVEVYGICTNFLQSAAVSTYFTIGAELGYHFIYHRGEDLVDLGYVKLGLYVTLVIKVINQAIFRLAVPGSSKLQGPALAAFTDDEPYRKPSLLRLDFRRLRGDGVGGLNDSRPETRRKK